MLEAKTEKQLRHIAKFFWAELKDWSIGTYPIRSLQMEESVTFDTMAKIVDYLRKENEVVEIPTSCRTTANLDGVSYDLRDTPQLEVMRFCKKLAWVKGCAFDYYYNQYVESGVIRI